MNTSTIIEIVGYVGSALVLISFLMSSVVKLRIVNTIGSLIFAVYALIIKSYPTAIMNICLVCINIYYLFKLRHKDPSYRLLSMGLDETYVKDFLQKYDKDLMIFFPGRKPLMAEANRVYMVFHESDPAGILIGHEEDGVLNVAIDYSTPAYRDCSVGKFLIANLPHQTKLQYRNAEELHVQYLKSLGFTENEGVWEKQL